MPKRLLPLGRMAVAAGLLLLAGAAAGHGEPRGHRAAPPEAPLTILSRHVVSGTPSTATDVRWASDQAVYVTRHRDGVDLVTLSPGGKSRVLTDHLLPDMASMNRSIGVWSGFARLAVSGDTVLAAASLQRLAWAQVDPVTGATGPIYGWHGLLNEDVDLHGRTMALLGMPPSEDPSEEQTGIVWLGSLDRELGDLRPILRDARAAAVPSYFNCALLELGAVRFREDGAFYVAPGIQPGLYLFDPRGKLVYTWDTRALGFDVDCRPLDKKKTGFSMPAPRMEFINQEGRRVLDEILVLPEGPGLVVRTWSHGGASWELFVLTASGVRRYPLPLTSTRPFDHLRGDVRNGRIALLRSPHIFIRDHVTAEAEIVVLAAPHG